MNTELALPGSLRHSITELPFIINTYIETLRKTKCLVELAMQHIIGIGSYFSALTIHPHGY